MKNNRYFIGVDVGSASVRAGLFDAKGKTLAQHDLPIDIYKPRPNFVEQSSNDIWSKTCKAVRKIVDQSGINKSLITGMAFDATCSLVLLDENLAPLTVSPTGNNYHNIIMWMDHRAVRQAAYINKTKDDVLTYVGGTISPEMQIPKILWLKENMGEQYYKAAKFMDLADFLAFKATGKDIRSICTMTCKWTYLAHEKRFSKPFFKKINLADLHSDNRLGEHIADIGTPIGGLTEETANLFNLSHNTVISVGAIDAHAGGIGSIGDDLEETIAIIGGTSSCHMALNKNPLLVPGVWGPYFSAMVPGLWLAEGGQSATGALLDHILSDSVLLPRLEREAKESNKADTIFDIIENEIFHMEKEEGEITRHFHLLGYFYGNRSPRADPTLRGMISGLSVEKGRKELAKHYLAAIQSVACGTRHIIEVMNENGYTIRHIHMTGGGTKNRLWLREHADITGCEITIPKEPQAVLLGSAMIAATGSGYFNNLRAAMSAMYTPGVTIKPDTSRKKYLDTKYKIFLEMYKDQKKYEKIMEKACSH